MPDSSAVLVVAPNWLGDAVMALPAIADVRQHFAPARLVVAARSSIADLFTLVPAVDSLVSADPAGVRQAGASTAILLPNSFASAWLVTRAGIPSRWGYAADLRSRLLTRAIRRPRTPLHQGAYYQYLVRELGIETGPLEPSLAIPPAAVNDARALLTARGWNGVTPLIVLAPGAAYGKAKQWIPSHVVRLVTDLARDRQATCALVGSRGDAATTAAIRAAVPGDCRSRILDLAGATTLPVLAAVLSLSRTCVANDSGAMHLAAAAGVPVVATFGSTNEHATSPLARAGTRTEVLTHRVWCRPCMLRECPIDHRCMTGIEPRQVLEAVDRVLNA
jgi:heptosyltransferase-2